MTTEERLGQIALTLIAMGIYPPYKLTVNDGQGQSVDLDVTMRVGGIHQEGETVKVEINVEHN